MYSVCCCSCLCISAVASVKMSKENNPLSSVNTAWQFMCNLLLSPSTDWIIAACARAETQDDRPMAGRPLTPPPASMYLLCQCRCYVSNCFRSSWGICTTQVSFRDAVWPDISNSSLADSIWGSSVHPDWQVHQLLADVLVYFIEKSYARFLGVSPCVGHEEK